MEQERIYHSYEEWQAGTLPWSIWGFAFGESGVLHEPEMVTKIHVLPEAEYQKIVQKQEEILGKHVACNLAFYVKEIEERLKAPGEIDERIEDEIREINEILTDKALNVVPIWYNEGQYHASGTVRLSPTGGKHVTPDFKNEIAFWYYKIIIKADPLCEPRKFITAEHEDNYTQYIPQVAVLVLYQFRQYLLNLSGFDIDKFTFLDKKPPQGKIHYGLCCRYTDQIFEGLRKYKPSRDEFLLFKEAFHQHPFASYERLRNDLPKIIDEIFERAAELRADLRTYFLEEMERDVIREIGPNQTLIHKKSAFRKMFRKRLKAMQEEEEKQLLEEATKEDTPAFTSAIRLNKTRGVRTDFLRVLDALWELKFFTDESGQVVTQKVVMKEFAEFLGEDFSTFSNDLSQSYMQTSLEKNVEVFGKMSEKIQKKALKARDSI